MFFTPEAARVPGIIRDITGILAKHNISIYNLTSSGYHPRGDRYIIFYADFGEADPEKVASEVLSVNHVSNVELIEPLKPGLVLDSITEELNFFGRRAIIFPEPVYTGLLVRIREELGSAGSAILYHEGLRAGKEAFKQLIKYVKNRSYVEVLRFGALIWRSLGFGLISFPEFNVDKGYVRVRIQNNFECRLFKGSTEPQSHFTRGLIAGWLEEFLNCRLTSKEVKCIAVGDPYCEIVFRKT